MMKWTHVCPLLGVVLLACATGENQDPEPLGLGSAGSEAGGGSSDATAGANTSGGSGATAGGSSSSGGTFSFSGSSSFAGTGFGTTGTTAGAAQGGAAGSGGTNGSAGGKATGGVGGAGGKATGGAGGMASAGAGGGGNAACAGTLPAKSAWKGTASQSDAAYPPAKAFDGDNSTRFSTGTKQVGGEWLQIDFGQVVTLDEITLFTNNDDYFRHYELRLSNTSQDFAAPVIKSADGATGSIVVPVAPARAGQYLTIRQTGADAGGDIAWWSLHEVSIACK